MTRIPRMRNPIPDAGASTAKRRAVIVGLDISLTSAGIAIIHPGWEPGRWDGIAVSSAGYKLDDKATAQQKDKRLSDIVDGVLDALQRAQGTFGRSSIADVEVFIEDYAWGMAQNAQNLGEISGCVKLTVLRALGRPAARVNNSSWRKLLIGVGKGKGIKEEVHRRLKSAGAPREWNGDQFDAFGVANYGRTEYGMSALTLVGRGEA
jgi:hypothetical protein